MAEWVAKEIRFCTVSRRVIHILYDFFYKSEGGRTLSEFIDKFIDRNNDSKDITRYYRSLRSVIKDCKSSNVINKLTPEDCIDSINLIKRFTFSDVEIFVRE